MIGIALQLFSVRDDLKKDLEGTLRKLKEIGYEGVEFAGPLTADAGHIKAVLDELGLKAVGWHTGVAMVTGDMLDQTLREADILGINRLVVPWMPDDVMGGNWHVAAQLLQSIGDRLALSKMKTGYHNHFTEFQPKDNAPWDIVFSNTNSSVIMQLDTGNALKGGGDILDIMKKYPGRADTVHLKPFSNTTEFNTLLGEDDTPWEEFFALCREVGGTEWYIIEFECEEKYTPLEGVELCYKGFMKYREAGKA